MKEDGTPVVVGVGDPFGELDVALPLPVGIVNITGWATVRMR